MKGATQMSTEVLDQLKDAIIGLQREEAAKLTKEAIAAGIDPVKVVEKGLRPSLDEIGEAFEATKIFLPELVAAGKIAGEVGDIVEAELAGDKEVPSKGTIALGTVKGDIHSIGKNIVAVMMKAFGFKVVDLGVDVSPEEFLEVVEGVDVVAMSGLLTTATKSMRTTIEQVAEKYSDKVVITGGAAMNPELAKALGVLYGPDAASGVRMLDDALT
jgi:5-methyltetrahydrofolate--homocysteine methyltransferase